MDGQVFKPGVKSKRGPRSRRWGWRSQAEDLWSPRPYGSSQVGAGADPPSPEVHIHPSSRGSRGRRSSPGRRRLKMEERRGCEPGRRTGSPPLHRECRRHRLCIHLAPHSSMCAGAGTSRCRRRQGQHARCVKSGKMVAASSHAFQDGVPDGSECTRLVHRRYTWEHAGGNVQRHVREQPSQYRMNPATPSSPPLTVEQSWACYRDLGE